MRRFLVLLLAIALVALFSTLAMAQSGNGNGGGGGNNSTLDITEVTAERVTVYAWDLDANFSIESKAGTRSVHEDVYSGSKNKTALFEVKATRYVESDTLTVKVEADLPSTVDAVYIDKIDVGLGGKTFELCEDDYTLENKTINFEVTIDEFTDNELSMIDEINLYISYQKNNQTKELTCSKSLGINTLKVNTNARIETNLLDVLGENDTADTDVDDWDITEVTDNNNLFYKSVLVTIDKMNTAKNIEINVTLKSNNKVLDSLTVTLNQGSQPNDPGNQNDDPGHNDPPGDPTEPPGEQPGEPPVEEEFPGQLPVETIPTEGFWLPPITGNFELKTGSVPIMFWLRETPAETPVLCIFEGSVSGDVYLDGTYDIDDAIITYDQNNLRTRKGHGNSVRTWGSNMPGAYYKYVLRARDLTGILDPGKTYTIAIMLNDGLLYFNEDTPAVLSFDMEKKAPPAINNKKDTASKRQGNRSYR